MQKLTQELVEQFIELEDDDFYIDALRAKHSIDPSSGNFHMAIKRMVEQRKIKRVGRGLYRKVRVINTVKWWDVDITEVLDFRFPVGHKYDDTSFGFDDLIGVHGGDLITIAGVSNAGKSAICKNILAENIDLFPRPVLMGNEYTNANGTPSLKFARSMNQIDWVEWMNGTGSKFDLIPVRSDWEDYIRADTLNIIDWINLTDNFFQIGKVLEDIKTRVGNGVVVAVVQKDEDKTLGRGAGFTRDLADTYLSIDPMGSKSRLTVGKVKDPKGKVMGRSWAFSINDYGAVLSDIYEVVKCGKCRGKGTVWRKGSGDIKCDACQGMGYKSKYMSDLEEYN